METPPTERSRIESDMATLDNYCYFSDSSLRQAASDTRHRHCTGSSGANAFGGQVHTLNYAVETMVRDKEHGNS